MDIVISVVDYVVHRRQKDTVRKTGDYIGRMWNV